LLNIIPLKLGQKLLIEMRRGKDGNENDDGRIVRVAWEDASAGWKATYVFRNKIWCPLGKRWGDIKKIKMGEVI
jgi:hypothetical protein